jgi:uncharacterized protein
VIGGGTVAKTTVQAPSKFGWLEGLFILLVIIFFIRNPSLAFLIFAGSGNRFGGSGGGGGFRGGGGSFGGGGSSGSW